MSNQIREKNRVGLITAIVALAAAFIVAVALMIYYITASNRYRQQIENGYQQVYYELMEDLGGIEIRLSKAAVSAGKARRSKLLYEVAALAEKVECRLNCLPDSFNRTGRINGFVNQLGSYSLAMARKESADYQMLLKLRQATVYILENCKSADGLLREDNPLWDTGVNNSNGGDSQFDFEGVFSDNPKGGEIYGSSLPQISAEQASGKVAEMFPSAQISLAGETNAETVPAFAYNVTANGKEMYVMIARHGGLPLLIGCGADGKGASLDRYAATEKAEVFLRSCGYNDLSSVWYSTSGNYANIDFAPMKDGVILYPDAVKVKIDLSNGDILGLEAFGYYKNHRERETLKPKANVESLKREISQSLEIVSERLVLIAGENESETLAYEIAGEMAGLQYFIYLDAESGEELNIFRVADTERGSLLL